MALIIEDGSQVANADSYVSVVDAEAVAEYYGLEFAGDIEKGLQVAYKWLNALETQMQGRRLSDIDTATTQTGIFPRTPVLLRGNLIDKNSIPVELIEAQVIAAYANESSNILLPTNQSTTGSIKKEELVGAVVQEFYQGSNLDSNETNPALQLALQVLEGLTKEAVGSGLFGGAPIVKGYS